MNEPKKDCQKGEWWTAPAIGDKGGTVIVTGRKDVDKFRTNPRMNIRVEVTWSYDGDDAGMPSGDTPALMAQVHERLLTIFDKDPVAVMTGVFTGDDERTWIFYTLSTHIFGRKLNECLSDLPMLPLTVYCENDPDWEQYDEMAEAEVAVD